ncbi:two-component regulator propeller domain-containing protein [Microlunatus speluncae]|uniref:two-component regulator propeller domain-containing protein n=1 Tax=Microlunatus speluncae TaxID=2594267 RepID=UPI001375B022|nr:two-component regulator propeller domain-containing protein [Microlunatus speluncae]
MDDSTTRRTLLQAGGVGLAAFAIGSIPGVAAAEPGSGSSMITDLGEPVHKTQTQSSAIAAGPDGRPLAYLCGEGNPSTPGEFAVVDLRARVTILDVRIAAGASIGRNLSISPTTGDVYFGTSDGAELYRYVPGADDVEHLGAISTEERIWALRADDDGTLWIGTYPGGLLLSYDPATGKTTDHGQALPGEQYISAIQPVGDLIYCGTQPNGRLATFDPGTATFTEVELPEGPVAADILDLNLRGTLLFVITGGRAYVRDTEAGTWVDTIPDVSGYGVSPFDPHAATVVYVRSGNVIKTYDTETRALTAVGWAPNATPETWAWIDLADPAAPGLSIAFTYWNNGRIYAFNPESRTSYYLQPELLGAGTQLVSINSGPDGNIYCGAYLSPPGMGRWDPDREAFELLAGTSQLEGIGTFNDDLVLGRYPQGRLYRYDLDRPWSMGTNPGRLSILNRTRRIARSA